MKKWILFLALMVGPSIPIAAYSEGEFFKVFNPKNNIGTSIKTNNSRTFQALPPHASALYVPVENAPVLKPLAERTKKFRALLLSYLNQQGSIFYCLQEEEGGTKDGDGLTPPARDFYEKVAQIFNQGNVFARTIEMTQPLNTRASQDFANSASAEARDFMGVEFQNLLKMYPCLNAEDTLRGLEFMATLHLPFYP